MMSFISRVIGLVLALALLIGIPLVSEVSINNLRGERMSWNYLELYTDIISDKGLITQEDFDDFQTNMSVVPVLYNTVITVERLDYQPISSNNTNTTSGYVVVYKWDGQDDKSVLDSKIGSIPNTATSVKLKAGDIVTIEMTPMTTSVGQRLVKSLTGLDATNHTITTSRMIRNDGGE